MTMNPIQKTQTGLTLVEVVIGTAILGAVLVAISITLTLYLQSATVALENTKALYLAEEGIAFAQYIRSKDWANIEGLTAGTVYYFAVAGSDVTTSGTPEVIDTDYIRSVVFRDVYRNANDNIVASTTAGSVVDTDARYVHVHVDHGARREPLSALITNIHND